MYYINIDIDDNRSLWKHKV